MGVKCRLLGHDYTESNKSPSQTFKVPRENGGSNEYIKRTTRILYYKCSRCGSKKTEENVAEELVIDDWKSANKEDRDTDIEGEIIASNQAHQEAKKKAPPVEIGDIVKAGVTDIKYHHSGKKEAVIRKDSFVIFVVEVPDNVEKGDILRAKVTSFGANKTCANAVLVNDLK